MENTEINLKLVNKDEILDSINSILMELTQKRIDNQFITTELNIIKELLDKEVEAIMPNPYKLPNEYSNLFGEKLIQVYFNVLSGIFGYDLKFISTKNRESQHVIARNIFTYLVYNSVGGKDNGLISLYSLGEFLGERHHSSMIHSLRTTEKELELNNPTYITNVFNGIKALRINKLKTSDIDFKTKRYIESKKTVKKINLEEPIKNLKYN